MTWFLSTRVGQRMHAWYAAFVGSGYSGELATLFKGTGIGPEEYMQSPDELQEGTAGTTGRKAGLTVERGRLLDLGRLLLGHILVLVRHVL